MRPVFRVGSTPDIMQLTFFHKSSKLTMPNQTSVTSGAWVPRGVDTVQLRKDTVIVAGKQHRPTIRGKGRPNSIPVEVLALRWVRRTIHAHQADMLPKKGKV
jgi:hypothetical protein